MDWTARAEEILRTWTDVQRKMWESWHDAMRSAGTAQSTEAWKETIAIWSEAVNRALQAQVEWTKFWTDSMTTGSTTPTEVAEWSQRIIDIMKSWAETQTQLSERWFETMKQADPTTMAAPWDSKEAQKVVQDWQEATQKLLEAQMGWLRIWTAAQAQQKQRGG